MAILFDMPTKCIRVSEDVHSRMARTAKSYRIPIGEFVEVGIRAFEMLEAEEKLGAIRMGSRSPEKKAAK